MLAESAKHKSRHTVCRFTALLMSTKPKVDIKPKSVAILTVRSLGPKFS